MDNLTWWNRWWNGNSQRRMAIIVSLLTSSSTERNGHRYDSLKEAETNWTAEGNIKREFAYTSTCIQRPRDILVIWTTEWLPFGLQHRVSLVSNSFHSGNVIADESFRKRWAFVLIFKVCLLLEWVVSIWHLSDTFSFPSRHSETMHIDEEDNERRLM